MKNIFYIIDLNVGRKRTKNFLFFFIILNININKYIYINNIYVQLSYK